MKKLSTLLIKLSLITAIALCAPKNTLALEDAIVAVVNDKIITLNELREYIKKSYLGLVAEGVDEQTIQQAMRELEVNGIKKLIEDRLILERAKEIGIKVKDKHIDARIEEVKQKYPSETDFIDALVSNGATVSDMRNKIRDQMQIKYVIDFEVRRRIYVNPQEITKYYDENLIKFQKDERVDLDSIFIPFEGNKSKARKSTQEALEKLQQSNDFAAIAKEYSTVPSIGIVEKGQLQEVIEKTVFNMDVGKTSDPLEVENGIFILHLKNKIPAQTAELAEVRDSIQKYLFKVKFKERFEKWLGDIKKDAYIEIKD